MERKINQIITALFELEAKGCHRTFLEYANGLFTVRIIKVETETIVYENTINLKEERKGLKKVLNHVISIDSCVMRFPYQCYRRKFVKGILCGAWEKCKSVIEYGEHATVYKQIDGSGCFIDDFENGLQYYVDYKHIIETNK